jgi:hypothetical protein
MKKKNRNVIAEYETEVDGQKVIVQKFKAKDKKVINNTRSNFISCPNCLSKLTLDEGGLQKCSGDRLVIWEKEFSQYSLLPKEKQLEYLKKISFNSMFMELYDRWSYSKIDSDDSFSCGFTNKIFLPIASCSVIIPDPAQVKRIEKKLGRKLTEEEIFGEKELFSHRGGIFEEYRDGARTVKITLLRFPEDCY